MRRLDDDLRQDTQRSGNEIGERLARNIDEGLGEHIRDRDVSVDVDTSLSPASAATTEAALNRITRDREVNVRINRRTLGRNLGVALGFIGTFALNLTRILGDLFDFGRQIGLIFSEAFRNFSGSAGGAASSAANLASGISSLAAAVAALAAVFLFLVGILGAITALLSTIQASVQFLLTLLPGFAFVAGASIAPLVLVFSNLSDALKALTKDTETFEKALEGLGPQTQETLRSLRGLLGFFTDIREQVQEAFFAPINEAVQRLGADLTGPVEEGFTRVAGAAGGFVADLIELFEHPQAGEFFENMFRLAELGFDEVGEAFANLVGSFANLANVTTPNVAEAIEGIADTIQGWADSINEFANDPNMQDTISEWQETFGVLLDFAGSLLNLVGTFLDKFREPGTSVLEDVTEQFDQWAEFLQSRQGETFMRGLFETTVLVLNTVIALVNFFGFMIQIIGGIAETIDEIKNLVGDWRDTLRTIADVVLRILEGQWERIRRGVERVESLVRRLRDRLFPVRSTLGTIAGFAGILRDALGAAVGFARTLRDTASQISFPSLPSPTGFFSNIFGADGGIFTRPTSKIIGEAGPEVLIPLTRPERALNLAETSGLADLIRGGDGGSLESISFQPEVRVFIGDQELRGMVRVEMAEKDRQTVRAVRRGAERAR